MNDIIFVYECEECGEEHFFTPDSLPGGREHCLYCEECAAPLRPRERRRYVACSAAAPSSSNPSSSCNPPDIASSWRWSSTIARIVLSRCTSRSA